jgi:hypothetical protein
MKKQNQVPEENGRTKAKSAQRKAPRRKSGRIDKAGRGSNANRFPDQFTLEEDLAISEAAGSLGLTVAEFAQRSVEIGKRPLTEKEIASVLQRATSAQRRAFGKLVSAFSRSIEAQKGGGK